MNDVDSCDALSDGMLHLQTCVHLEEVEVLLRIHQKLDRSRRVVADRLGELHGLLAHRSTCLFVEKRAGSLLDHLLVTTLNRTLALVEVNAMPMVVTQHLQQNPVSCKAAKVLMYFCYKYTFTWISMWRGLSMNFSISIRSSPKLDFASDLHRAKPFLQICTIDALTFGIDLWRSTTSTHPPRLIIVPCYAHSFPTTSCWSLHHHGIS